MNNKRKDMLFMIVTLVLCVLLFAQRLTGGILHAVLGVVLIIMMAVHLYRQGKKLKNRKTSFQAADIILIVSLLVLFVTGMLLHPLHGMLTLKILHKLAAVLFVVGIFVHVVQHRKMVRR